MVKILKAEALSWHVCDHGTIYLRLHAGDGRIFAGAALNVAEARQFIEGTIAAIGDAVDITGPRAGHA